MVVQLYGGFPHRSGCGLSHIQGEEKEKRKGVSPENEGGRRGGKVKDKKK